MSVIDVEVSPETEVAVSLDRFSEEKEEEGVTLDVIIRDGKRFICSYLVV